MNNAEYEKLLSRSLSECLVIEIYSENINLEKIKNLIDQKADVNYKFASGITPFIHACIVGNVKIVQILLDHNADVNIQTKYGSTALKSAFYSGKIEIVNILIANGADIHTPNNCGNSILLNACQSGNLKIVKLALKLGFDSIEGDDINHWTEVIKKIIKYRMLRIYFFLI